MVSGMCDPCGRTERLCYVKGLSKVQWLHDDMGNLEFGTSLGGGSVQDVQGGDATRKNK